MRLALTDEVDLALAATVGVPHLRGGWAPPPPNPAGHDGVVTEVDRQIRATSFGSAADDYARYRPAPPAEAAAWAVGPSPGLVIDVAAGTGHLARHLLRSTNRLVAVDIDRRMLAALGDRLPGVPRVAARGEELPFVSGAAGAVVISSAWHWLGPDRRGPRWPASSGPGGPSR